MVGSLCKSPRINHEAHLSAFRRSSQAHARFSRPHAFAWGACSHPCSTGERSGPSIGLTDFGSKGTRSRCLFGSEQRLRSVDIGSMFKAGKPRRTALLAVTSKPNGINTARFAVIVPKRYLRRAVDRNRAKRLLKEWFRLNQANLVGQDLLVRLVAQPSMLEVLPGQLHHLLARPRR